MFGTCSGVPSPELGALTTYTMQGRVKCLRMESTTAWMLSGEPRSVVNMETLKIEVSIKVQIPKGTKTPKSEAQMEFIYHEGTMGGSRILKAGGV